MSPASAALRRALGSLLTSRRGAPRQLDGDLPSRVLVGADVHDARAHLVRLGAVTGRGVDAVRHTGHGALELWSAGVPVRYRLDERGEVSVEFGNGFVLMASARRAGSSAMHLTPLRRDLAALELLLVPLPR